MSGKTRKGRTAKYTLSRNCSALSLVYTGSVPPPTRRIAHLLMSDGTDEKISSYEIIRPLGRAADQSEDDMACLAPLTDKG